MGCGVCVGGGVDCKLGAILKGTPVHADPRVVKNLVGVVLCDLYCPPEEPVCSLGLAGLVEAADGDALGYCDECRCYPVYASE